MPAAAAAAAALSSLPLHRGLHRAPPAASGGSLLSNLAPRMYNPATGQVHMVGFPPSSPSGPQHPAGVLSQPASFHASGSPPQPHYPHPQQQRLPGARHTVINPLHGSASWSESPSPVHGMNPMPPPPAAQMLAHQGSMPSRLLSVPASLSFAPSPPPAAAAATAAHQYYSNAVQLARVNSGAMLPAVSQWPASPLHSTPAASPGRHVARAPSMGPSRFGLGADQQQP